jgi:hypothetical protein
MRVTSSRTLAAFMCLVLGMAGLTVSAFAADPQLTIATVSIADNRLTIAGTHFGGGVPSVTLAGSALAVVSHSETEIVAETPYLGAGMYVLEVTRDDGATPEGRARTSVVIR